MRLPLHVVLLTALLAAACAKPVDVAPPPSAAMPSLAGQFVLERVAGAARDARVGGLSGLSRLDGGEVLAAVDDGEHPRVIRLRVGDGDPLRISVAAVIPLRRSTGAPGQLDAEGIALTCERRIIITSEGIGHQEPRQPPAILEYSLDGDFLRHLPVALKYSPTAHGELTSGVRPNAGFESLALTDDCARLFTATELPLVQDGEDDAFRSGVYARILEYRRSGASYEPAREFAYEIAPIERPSFDVRVAINGLVELLWVGGDQLLALERAFVESTDGTRSMNRIRIFRIDLDGATDVVARPSLRDAAGIVAVRKTLLVDVNALPGLQPPLAQLDNFEGMTWGPASADGRRPLLLVSDDNFSERQVTGFLLLRIPH